MKNLNFLATLFFCLTFFFFSCGGNGISDELKNEIENFEKEWQATGESSEAYRVQLFTDDSLCSLSLTKLNTDSASVVTIKETCKKNNDSYAEMKTLHDGFIAGWNKDSKDWAAFKNKAMKGEIASEEVNTEMESWKKKLETANKTISDWNDELDKMRVSSTISEDIEIVIDSTFNNTVIN